MFVLSTGKIPPCQSEPLALRTCPVGLTNKTPTGWRAAESRIDFLALKRHLFYFSCHSPSARRVNHSGVGRSVMGCHRRSRSGMITPTNRERSEGAHLFTRTHIHIHTPTLHPTSSGYKPQHHYPTVSALHHRSVGVRGEGEGRGVAEGERVVTAREEDVLYTRALVAGEMSNQRPGARGKREGHLVTTW